MHLYEEQFTYRVILDLYEIKNKVEMYSWCTETFGSCIINPDKVWCHNNDLMKYEFRFKHEADRNWFILRWS